MIAERAPRLTLEPCPKCHGETTTERNAAGKLDGVCTRCGEKWDIEWGVPPLVVGRRYAKTYDTKTVVQILRLLTAPAPTDSVLEMRIEDSDHRAEIGRVVYIFRSKFKGPVFAMIEEDA